MATHTVSREECPAIAAAQQTPPGEAVRMTEGGLARKADGALADMPRELADSVNAELFDVLTLLWALREMCPCAGPDADGDGLTDSSSRTVALAAMADAKVRGVLATISPYV